MKRNEWEFHVDAHELAQAANNKREHHLSRMHWWEQKKSETMEKVKASGIEVHDSVGAEYSNTKGIAGPQIRIDAALQRDLSECQVKIRQHFDEMNEYAGWQKVMAAAPPTKSFPLNHEDWLYFFGT